MKAVFQTTTTLPHREDKTHVEVAVDTVKAIRAEHPQFESLWWNMSLKENHSTGEATLAITVMDPNQPGKDENIKFLLLLAVIAIIVGLIAYT